MFGIRREGPKDRMAEKDILSMLDANGAQGGYVVGEEIRLMGIPAKSPEGGQEIVILKPGDEIRVLEPVAPFNKYDLEAANNNDGKVRIVIFNEEYGVSGLGKSYLVPKSNLEGRKIKLNESAKRKYT
jgi:hypothetical protein